VGVHGKKHANRRRDRIEEGNLEGGEREVRFRLWSGMGAKCLTPGLRTGGLHEWEGGKCQLGSPVRRQEGKPGRGVQVAVK